MGLFIFHMIYEYGVPQWNDTAWGGAGAEELGEKPIPVSLIDISHVD
jgi:hypothetical protein